MHHNFAKYSAPSPLRYPNEYEETPENVFSGSFQKNQKIAMSFLAPKAPHTTCLFSGNR